VSHAAAYHYAFAVACLSLVLSIAIYYAFRSTFKHADNNAKTKDAAAKELPELSKQETKDRVVALCLVFAVVIFFWMAFHQNGSTLTFFANEYTARQSFGLESMMFDVTNLLLCIIIIYGLFSLFGSKTSRGRLISGLVILACVAGLCSEILRHHPRGRHRQRPPSSSNSTRASSSASRPSRWPSSAPSPRRARSHLLRAR